MHFLRVAQREAQGEREKKASDATEGDRLSPVTREAGEEDLILESD